MRIYNVEVTDDQRKAGLQAMVGSFRSEDVRAAMSAAGVPEIDETIPSYRNRDVLHRAADRLLQAERKAGRIRAVNNKNWCVVDPTT